MIAFPLNYFLQIEPVNVVIEQANSGAVPTNWEQLRNQWEYAHAANFGFSLAGFSALLLSDLVETPTSYFRDSVQQPNDPIG